MPIFGTASMDILKHVHPNLVAVLYEAIKDMDFSLTCGQRGRAAQESAHAKGNSNAHFGQSPHNFAPALAVDIIPYPFTNDMWNKPHLFEIIARHIQKVAAGMGDIKYLCDWGGDWHSIKDYPHIELRNWKFIKGNNLAP